MRSNAGRILVLGWAAALAATACKPFPDVNPGRLRIARVMAVDVGLSEEPQVSAEDPGNDVTLADVPVNFTVLRVEFNRPLDGSTVLADPADCGASSNVQVTVRDAGGAVVAQESQLCYSPNGFEPAIDLTLLAPSADGPAPVEQLEPGFQYTLTATGVRDQDGNSLDFSVTLQAASAP